jgi:hypothetical protein
MVVGKTLKKPNTGNLVSAQPDVGDVSAGLGEFTFNSGLEDFSVMSKKHLRVNLQNHRPEDEVESPVINLSPSRGSRSISPEVKQ